MNNYDEIYFKIMKIRFEFYNIYENKEEEFYKKYKENEFFNIVKESFNFSFKEIGIEMPKLINKYYNISK